MATLLNKDNPELLDRMFTNFRDTEDENILSDIYETYKNKLELCDIEQLELLASHSYDVQDILFEKVRNNNYKASDEVLAYMAKQGDAEAKEIIAIDYIKHIERVVRNLIRKGRYSKGYEPDDLIQEGYIGFYNAIKDFKIELKTSFKAFTQLVVTRYINSLITDSNNGKKIALNDSLSYHTPVGSDSETTFEQMLSTDDYSPESYTSKKETLSELWDLLSDIEKGVLIYYSEDYTYEEIGSIIFGDTHETKQKQNKAVDNAMQRINNKRDLYLESEQY